MKKTVKTVSFMVVATMLAKVMGMVRDIFMTNLYGTTVEAAAYVSASRIPVLFFDFTLGVAILSTFIPVFNRYLQQGDRQRAMEFSNNFINLVGLISVVFCAIGMVFPRQLTMLIASGLDENTLALASRLVVIILPTVVFTTLAYCFVGILQSLGEFNIPAIISLISNLAVIVYLLFFNDQFGIYGVAVAMVIGWSLQMLVQIPSLVKKGYRYRFTLNIKDPGIKEVFVLALPVLVSSWVQPISVTINTNFASYLNGGRAVAAMDYANRLYIILVGVFAFAITNYIFPALSKMSGGGDEKGVAEVTRQSLQAMLLIIAPVMAGMMLLAKPIISLIYGRGAFDATDVELTSTALFYFSIGMASFGVNEIANKCFYARKEGKTPMVAAIVGILTTVALAFLFTNVLQLGIGGLALSSALGAVAVSAVLLMQLQRKLTVINRPFVVFVLKVAVAAAIMSVVVFGVKYATAGWGDLLQIACCTAAGAIVYVICLLALKMKEIREVLS